LKEHFGVEHLGPHFGLAVVLTYSTLAPLFLPVFLFTGNLDFILHYPH
jgi:hypothetical protein